MRKGRRAREGSQRRGSGRARRSINCPSCQRRRRGELSWLRGHCFQRPRSALPRLLEVPSRWRLPVIDSPRLKFSAVPRPLPPRRPPAAQPPSSYHPRGPDPNIFLRGRRKRQRSPAESFRSSLIRFPIRGPLRSPRRSRNSEIEFFSNVILWGSSRSSRWTPGTVKGQRD